MTFWYLVISLPLLPVYLTFLTCLVVYEKIIFTILKLRYGNVLTPIASKDCFFTIGKFEENFSHILTIMNTSIKEEDLKNKIVEVVDVKIIQNHEHFKRFLSSLHSFMGYPFFIRQEIEAADLISIVDVEENNYESINHMAYEYSIKPLNKQNKLLFEIIILKCSSEWKAKSNLKVDQIPLLTRIHHVLGDGLSTMNLIVQLFGDNKLAIDKVIDEFNTKHKRSQSWMRLFENFYFFLLVPGYIVCDKIKMMINNRSSLNIFGSGKQYFAFNVGDEMLLNKIKEFKKKIGNLSFSEILFTAISASLYDYFKKKNGSIPITIETLVAAVRGLEKINKNGLPILTNQFGFASFEIPIEIGSESMLKRISNVKQYTRAPNTIINFLVLRFLNRYLLGLFPSCIKRIFLKTKCTTLIISNLPGIGKITSLNGIELDEAYFFVISRENLGIGFSVISYNNKIHLGLKAFENIITSQEDCQLLVDNVFEYLNKLVIESYD